MANFSTKELAVIAIALDEEENERKKRKKGKRKWVDDLWKKRETEGEFMLFKQLLDSETKFFKYFRMSQDTFHLLLEKLEPHIKKNDTSWRRAVSPKERLAVCLRFLATGDSLQTISFSYRLGHSTVQTIVTDTLKVICETLLHEVIPRPTKEMWEKISKQFLNEWNFPNCLGALDGKHVNIQAPPKSGSQYFNYKKTFSVVLLALVDAQYNFIMVDVGSFGKNSDGGIFSNSNLYKGMEQGKLCVPEDACFPNTITKAPYAMVGDEAFPLKRYLMRPYAKHDLDEEKSIYNYRLCRARRVVENAFGILCQKFRIYNRRIHAIPENVDIIVLATCILHNFIKMHDKNTYTYGKKEKIEVPEQCCLNSLRNEASSVRRDAFEVREMFKCYFNSEAGSVAWQ